MKIRLSSKRTRVTFDNAYESAMVLGRTNENYFCLDAALNNYRRAAANAPDEARKRIALAHMERIEKSIELEQGLTR